MKILVVGGAGFIGSNSVHRLVSSGHKVTIVDDLSRKGSAVNVAAMKKEISFAFERVDIRRASRVNELFRSSKFDAVLHLAAQVAVTTSVVDPRADFEINALGTFNLLDAARRFCPESAFLYASTNKVYGKMADVSVKRLSKRYVYAKISGIDEQRPLDFYSPYGCSKGAADQYVRDYGRIYGLRTVVLRQSCIYGPRQYGVEDQGWVAWFIIAALSGRPITIYGDGKQVRDLLYVDDLTALYEQALRKPDACSGEIYNVGGGPQNTLSLLELLAILEARLKRKIPVSYDQWRQGDQPIFVCDIAKVSEDLGWKPRTGVARGVERLTDWVQANLQSITKVLDSGPTPRILTEVGR